MQNADQIRIFRKWQASCPPFEPYLCRINRQTHRKLIAVESGGIVVMACQDCGTAHGPIPESVLRAEALLDKFSMVKSGVLGEKAHVSHVDPTWVYGNAALGGGLVGFASAGSTGALVGALMGPVLIIIMMMIRKP